MNLLLDSHVFLWWSTQSAQLSPIYRAACEDPQNTLLLSVASVWELQIKTQLGKLRLTRPLPSLIARQVATNGLLLLPVELQHIFALAQLPPYHRDPFDRLLIAQAFSEGAKLMSVDETFPQYGVPILT